MENKHLLKNATSFKKYWHILLMVLALFATSFSAFSAGILHIASSSTNQIRVHKWNGDDTSWPGTQIVATAVVLGGSSGGTGGFYTHTVGGSNYLLHNGSGGQTGDLSISQDTWGIYNGTNTFTVLMTASTMTNSNIVQFASGGFAAGNWTTKYNSTYNSTTKKFTYVGTYTAGSGVDIYINSTKFRFVATADITGYCSGCSATTIAVVFDPYTGGISMVQFPTISTPTSASIDATSAILGANVTNAGGGTVSARGTVWGTSASPTGNSSSQGTGTGTFTHSRTGLTANTLYYYRGYATNEAGTSYTSDGTFTTLPAAPTVGSGSGATGNSFTANWSHPSQGAAVSYTYEVQVSTDNSTWASPINVTDIASSNTSASITGLAAGTTYYYRVLARNATGAGAWSASSAAIATTSSSSAPSITSSAATSVSSGTGTMNGNISSNGGASIDDYGFYWSTTNGFADGAGTKVQVGTSNYTGAVSSVLSSLTNGTTYYYKAYAHNSVGTTYGTQQSFTPCSAPVSYAQSVTITACGSKTIDLTAGLTGSIPGDAGTVTYTVSPVGDGLTISGSTATFSATANKTYTITISFSNAAYCSVSGTLSVTYTNNTPSISLTNTKTGKSASATYPYEAFVLTATTDNTPVTWTLTQPSGVTDGTLTISADTKTATFVGGTSNASPYTIEAATVAVGSCSAASVEYDVYVDAPEAENCTAPTNCNSNWAYRFDSDATDGTGWDSFTYFTCTGNGVWTRTFVLPGDRSNWNFKIWHSSNSGGSYTQNQYTFNSKGITSYSGSKTWTIVLTEGASAGAFTFVILEGDHTSTGGSTPTNPTVLRGAAASVNSGTSEATLYGYLKFTGCSTITDYGFQYANNASFTGATSVTTTGSLTAASTYNKTFDVSGLSVGTYYYRAYATNDIGTDYSDSATFVIANLKPALTTTAATSIGKTSGTMNGNISSNGGSSITDYGFYYSTTNGFADGTGTKVQVGTSDYTGNVSHQLTGLTTGTTYYYKAYATSASGTSYGTQQSFTPAVAIAVKPCAGQTWALNSATTPVALDFGSSTIGTSDYETISVLVVGASGKTLNVNSTSGFKMYNSSDDSYDRPVGFAIASDSVCVSVPLRWLPDTDELGTTQDGMTIKGTVSFMVDAITASADTLAVQGTVTPNVLVYPSSAMVMVGQNQTINIAKSCTTTPTATITTGNAAEWTINYTPASGNKNGTFSIAFDNSVSAVTGSNLASAVLTITDCDSTRTVALSGHAAVTAPTITSLTADVCDNDFTSFGAMHVSDNGYLAGESFTGTYSYQWQKYNTGTSSWDNYTDGLGATTNNIRPPFSGQYRCIVTRDAVSVASNTVTLSAAGSGCSATTFSTNLPVVIISTSGQGFPVKCSGAEYWSQCIPNPSNVTPNPEAKTRIHADVKILWDGTASDTDGLINQGDIDNLDKLHYDRKTRVSYRGSSSMNFTKKSYAFVTGEPNVKENGEYRKGKTNIFNLSAGTHSAWILYAAFVDASMMRNKLALDMYADMIDLWTPQSRYVELYVDGEYKGVYVFMEKVEESSTRVNLGGSDHGYLFKFDKTDVFDRAEDRHASDPDQTDGTTFFTSKTGKKNIGTYNSVVDQAFEMEQFPGKAEIGDGSGSAEASLALIKSKLTAFETALAAGNFENVRQLIDYETWADWFIIAEFTKNPDAFRASTWFALNDINAKVRAIPIWDYELGFNNNATSINVGNFSTAGFFYNHAGQKSDAFPIPFWWEGGDKWSGSPKGLLDDPCFRSMIKSRWAVHTGTGGALSAAVIDAKIAAMHASLNQSNGTNTPIAREIAQNPLASRNQAGYNAQNAYATQKSTIETWITNRRSALNTLILNLAGGIQVASAVGAHPTNSTYATYHYDPFVLTLDTEDTPIEWQLTQPTGVTDGYLIISADTKSATLIAPHHTDPYTLTASSQTSVCGEPAVLNYNVYVNETPTECSGGGTTYIRVKKQDSYASNTPNIYVWTGSGGSEVKYAGNWPGTAMTSSGDWWVWSTTAISAGNFIINGTGSQTADLTFTGDRCISVNNGAVTNQTCPTTSTPNALLGTAPVINNVDLEVTLNGYTGNTGCATITAYGFQYADNPSFTGATTLSTSDARTQGQTFSSPFDASGLTCGDTYYYRSFLTNSVGTDYSVTGTFEAPCEPCTNSGVTYDQEVFINACDANKVIDLSAGLSGTIPGDAGTLTYSVVGDATGLSINGSNATFSGSASKDYRIQVEFSAGDYCAVKDTLSVSYTNNTPALGFTNTLTPSGLSHVTYPYKDFVLEATTLVPSNATIEWSLIRTGVTGGEITVSPNGKSVTFVTDQLAADPNKYTIRGTIPAVGTCVGVTTDWDVYVNSESCAAANSSTVVRLTDPGYPAAYVTAGWNGTAYVYVHYIKASDGVTLMEPLKAWPGTWTPVSNGYSSITIDGATFADAKGGEVNVQFRSRYDYSGNTGKTASIPVTSGNIYTVSLTGSHTGSGTDRVFDHSVSSTANASAPIVSRGFAPDFNDDELTLNGYVQCKNGADITAHGFQYATNAAFTNAVTVNKTPGTINEATAFSSIVDVEDLNCTTTYYYRAFATNSSGTAYSDASTFYVPASQYCIDCGSFEGDTITFTIDSDFTVDNDCDLRYRSLEGAVAKLKATPDFYDAATTELKKFIIMNVVPRTTPYAGTANPVFSGGGENIGSYTVHMIDDINDLDAEDYQYKYNGTVPRTLTIQSASATVKPSIKSIILRRVKNVRLSNLAILGTTTSTSKETNALDIDNGSGKWIADGPAGRYKDGNITIENSYITSKGFTCVHVSAYDGVTFRNNDFEAKLTDAELSVSNTQQWGASAKFIRTTDILFERNNFRGDHATLVWLQESKNVLFMNNVFWATNNVNAQQAFIKLLSQEGNNNVENNAFYYNTLFLNNGTSNNTQIDFFRLGRADIGSQSANQDKYIASGIAFEYNNCYSYEPTVTGKRADTFLGRTPADFTLLRNNNFWSISGGTSSDGLEFGTGATNIHVKQELCSTAPNDPMGLVVKGADLNVGSALETDITGLGAMSIHRNDRLRTTIRPVSGTGWTIGAYQQTDGIPVNTIIWTGAFDNDWDNRNNWIDAATRQTLSCVHQLSEDLVVIIPSYTGSEIYQSPTGQIEHEPILPAQFASDATHRPIKLDNEHVDAGAGLTTVTPSQFAKKIDIEYGGSLLNAHKLKPGEDRRYDEVTMHLDLNDRKEWVLVGPVVQPFTDGNKTAVRQLQSGDFFLNFEPHVYMNYVNIDTSTGAVTWAAPFTQLTEPVGPQQIFAIRVPDQYGNQKPLLFKRPAQFYYLDRFGGTAEQRALGTAPIKYTFNGRLSDEAGLRQYTIGSAHQLLSNTFPANLDAATVAAAGGTVRIWDYDFKSFETAVGGDMIKPMHGFIYSRSNAEQTSLQVTDAMIVFGNTKYRKRTVTQPLFRMNVNNTNNTYGSRINVKYDADKADTFDGMIDSEKLFNDQDLNVPEMYMMAYSKKLSQKGINKQTEIIPLGIRTNVEKSLKFTRQSTDGYEEVILEDRQSGTTYDMLATNAEYIINNVPAGNNEGRFYLHLTVAEDRIPSTIGEETIGSSDAEELDIAIFAQGKQVTVSSSQNLVIETILVSDMAGRTQVFTASNPHFNQLNLQVAQGTYIVKVIGDKATKEAKVIIK